MRKSLPIEHFEMVPLDQFVVTERNHKALPKMLWGDWRDQNDYPEYDILKDPKTNKERNIHQKQPKPKDVEVTLEQGDIDAGYYITWED